MVPLRSYPPYRVTTGIVYKKGLDRDSALCFNPLLYIILSVGWVGVKRKPTIPYRWNMVPLRSYPPYIATTGIVYKKGLKTTTGIVYKKGLDRGDACFNPFLYIILVVLAGVN